MIQLTPLFMHLCAEELINTLHKLFPEYGTFIINSGRSISESYIEIVLQNNDEKLIKHTLYEEDHQIHKINKGILFTDYNTMNNNSYYTFGLTHEFIQNRDLKRKLDILI